MYEMGATFSEDGKYRYKLWRVWNPRLLKLVWIMLNPSTADGCKDDPTIKKVIAFSMNWRYGGCVVLNLFAWRSTDPRVLVRTIGDIVGSENDNFLSQTVDVVPPLVCAWGKVAKKLQYRVEVVKELLEGADFACLGTNSDGSPKHPLYVAGKTQLVKWR